jgi:ABC-type amino acid transport substrate-binding protein
MDKCVVRKTLLPSITGELAIPQPAQAATVGRADIALADGITVVYLLNRLPRAADKSTKAGEINYICS